jgi:L-lactate dehydrogenase
VASRANVQLHEYCRLTGMSCTREDMVAMATRVRDSAYEIIRRKGATNLAIAAALTRNIEAVVRDQASVLTVSTLVDGHYGIHGVCLSLPAIVDRSGIRRVLPIPLSEEEITRLRRSADAVRDAVSHAGL